LTALGKGAGRGYSAVVELERCLDIGGAVSAPPFRTEPESEWAKARDEGTIPFELYDLYRLTSFLSVSRIAGFDTEYERLISTYFARVMRSILDCLDEAAALVVEADDHLKQTHTPLKKLRGEKWDKSAGRKFRATFRLFLIDLTGSLDAAAELVGLILPGAVTGLQPGKASFSILRSWAGRALVSPPGIVYPAQHYSERLHDSLVKVVRSDRPESDWFELLRMYRNKVTHLGHQSWLHLGLQSDDDEIYYFLPRTWPFVPERHLRVGTNNAAETGDIKQHLRASLVHVDIATFSADVLAKVRQTVGTISAVLAAAYVQTGRLDASMLGPLLDAATITCAFQDFGSASNAR
jgi:hypothetical protein